MAPPGQEESIIPPGGRLGALPGPLCSCGLCDSGPASLGRQSLLGFVCVCVCVSVWAVPMMSALPHTWEARRHTAPELRGWVTTSVAAASQGSWPLWERSFSFQVCCGACEETYNCLCHLFFPCGDKSPFSCCGMHTESRAQRLSSPGPESAQRGR